MPLALTKFTTFHKNLFDLNNGGIKISLPSEFNDILDSQIFFDKNSISSFAQTYKMNNDLVEFIIDRLKNTCHILSLSAKSALESSSANMWGLYADKGRGIALEFEFDELKSRCDETFIGNLAREFNRIDNENYQNSMFSLQKIQATKNNKKLNYCLQTDVGLKGMLNFYERLILLDISRNNFKISRQYEQLKHGAVDLEMVQFVDRFFQKAEYLKFPGGVFLHEVKYYENDKHYNSLYDSVYAHLLRERYIGVEQINQDIEQQCIELHLHKSKIWEYEEEYRIISLYYFYQYYAKKIMRDSTLDEHSRYLNDFKIKNKNSVFCLTYNNNPIQSIEDNLDEIIGGGIPLINLPYPKNIYLGWEFEKQLYANEKKQAIIAFCEEYGVGLYQLQMHLDSNYNFALEKLL